MEVKFGFGLEAVDDFSLFHRLQEPIAADAAVEGEDLINQLEAGNHLKKLLLRIKGTRAITHLDNFPH